MTAREWADVYVPLAHVIGLHLDSHLDLRRRLGAAGLHRVGNGPFIVTIAGSVASGKTTFAGAVAALITARADRPSVEILSTDGFLHPNAVLAPQGLVMRKGFPGTYDQALITRTLGALAEGVPSVTIPSYSHSVYDIDGDPQVLRNPDVVILEGVNTLQPGITEYGSMRIYVDADAPDLRRWYVDRFLGLIEEARTDSASFFTQWVGLSPDAARAQAVAVWEDVNLPNLTEHILATRWRADIVLHKAGDHAVDRVAVRAK
ncbi:MAG: type I pantothenate kinase [Acidimicrobiales bacterium]